ncbi:type 1 glutamine amidotransferase [Agrilactobacillus fermenti]|uniref:type 1 glutamine amidotransferase n=1 Tax=Agrilactobacillus fermenti TaxID=2586909 RepID=UPI001E28B482|nr:type 1 glutamine amidotransferase [Agrilactobacillus fermenti]MCD2256294.1 GMP synthase [Agrilactobacillus fermenti]
MKIDIIMHVPHEGPGLLETIAAHFQDQLIYHRLYEEPNAIQKIDPKQVTFLIVMGGPMSANDDLPWLPLERQLIKAVYQNGGRVLGICLGAQQVALAFNGRVAPMRYKELGWFPVASTVEDLPSGLVFHWHGEKIELPDIAQQIYTNDHCPAQGFRIGDRVYGLQFHPEMTQTGLDQLLAADAAYLDEPSETVQSLAQMQKFDWRTSTGQRITEMIYEAIRNS